MGIRSLRPLLPAHFNQHLRVHAPDAIERATIP